MQELTENKAHGRISRELVRILVLFPMTVGHLIGAMTDKGILEGGKPLLTLLCQLSLLAPPVFFCGIADGAKYTHSRKKYGIRLLVMAVITQLAHCLLYHGTVLTLDIFSELNVIFTLFLGLLACSAADSRMKLPAKIALIVLITAASVVLWMEWLGFGILYILIFFCFCDKIRARTICYTVLSVIYCFFICGMRPIVFITPMYWEAFLSVMAAYLLLCLSDNGKRRRLPAAKWIFYIYYPLHLLVIYFICLAVQ